MVANVKDAGKPATNSMIGTDVNAFAVVNFATKDISGRALLKNARNAALFAVVNILFSMNGMAAFAITVALKEMNSTNGNMLPRTAASKNVLNVEKSILTNITLGTGAAFAFVAIREAIGYFPIINGRI